MEPERDRPSPRPPGRPRVWESDAERARAYRAAKAAELAEPLQLRDALLDLRQLTKSLKSELAKERKRGSALRLALDRANERVHSSRRRSESLRNQLDVARADLERLRARLRQPAAPVRFMPNR